MSRAQRANKWRREGNDTFFIALGMIDDFDCKDTHLFGVAIKNSGFFLIADGVVIISMLGSSCCSSIG